MAILIPSRMGMRERKRSQNEDDASGVFRYNLKLPWIGNTSKQLKIYVVYNDCRRVQLAPTLLLPQTSSVLDTT